jgi:hypothetical protein
LIGWAAEAAKHLRGLRSSTLSELGYEVSSPDRLSREYGERGTPYVSGSDLYGVRVAPGGYIVASPKQLGDYSVKPNRLLLQASGQRYGLLGRPWITDRRLEGIAVSHDLLRVNHADPEAIGYLYALFNGDFGRRLLLSTSHGTQIPHLAIPLVEDTRVPELSAEKRAIGREAMAAWELTIQADLLEREAIEQLEAQLGAR